jgi:hypothetical protein
LFVYSKGPKFPTLAENVFGRALQKTDYFFYLKHGESTMATQQARSNLLHTTGVGSLHSFRSIDGASMIGADDNNTTITLTNSGDSSKDITFEDASKCMGTIVDLNVVGASTSNLVIKGVKSGVITLNKNDGVRARNVSARNANDTDVTIAAAIEHAKLTAICDGTSWFLSGFLMSNVAAG